MGLAVRAGRAEDAPALLALSLAAIRISAAAHYAAAELEAWAEGRTLADHQETLKQRLVRVAELDGEIAGFASLDLASGLVGQLFVAPSAGGRGVARRLLEAVEAAAREAGLEHLNARASRRAVAVFERLGFERVSTECVAVGQERLECFSVRRALGEAADPRGRRGQLRRGTEGS